MWRSQGLQVTLLTEEQSSVLLEKVDIFEVSEKMFTVEALEARGYLLFMGQLRFGDADKNVVCTSSIDIADMGQYKRKGS